MENLSMVATVLLIIILATHLAGTFFAIWFWIIKRYRFTFMFAWYDIWVGGFYDANKDIYYWLPLPMIGFKFEPKGDQV